MPWNLFFALWGCTGGPDPFAGPIPERPTAFVDPGLRETGAPPPLQLWRVDAQWELPATTLPEGFSPTSRFPIVLEEATKDRKQTRIWRATSPFVSEIQSESRVSAPPGMELWIGDEKLDYSPSLAGRSWRLSGKYVAVAWPGEEAPVVAVSYSEARDAMIRRDFGAAGLPAQEFVQHTLTLADQTRQGLLIPAPGRGTWSVTLPAERATFDGWLAIAALPLRNLQSDGAYASLVVSAGGEETVVDRKFVGADDGFTHWRVDLSRWAGQPVQLALRTESYGSPDFDQVFVGSPSVHGAPTGPVRRVIVIGLDTTRPDHFSFYGYGRDTTPELDRVAGTSSVFMRAWTPAPRTRPSFRAATTGRYPLDAVGAKNIGAVFQEHGFATAGIVANVHLQPRFDFNKGFDWWWFDGKAKADEQVDRALEFLADNADRDTYLFLHVMDPHLFYVAPNGFRDMYASDPDPTLPDSFSRWDVYDWARKGKLDDRRKKHIEARYDGEIRYMSQELGRLFDKLDRMEGRSLVVLHSDHGEEFWEHGKFEHNHTVYDETTRALLWFRSGPGQANGAKLDVPATLADIGPTLYELAGFADAPPTDGHSLAGVLLGTDDASGWGDRPLGVAHLRYGTERWGVVWQDHKYVLHTASGDEELYDLRADPQETRNLAVRTPLGPYRDALSRAHAMPVGRGWRIRVDLFGADRTPFRFTLPAAAKAAGVIDPEATVENPANQAWGETPHKRPADIGAVELQDDGRTLVYTPGEHAQQGLLYVLFDADVDATQARWFRGDQPLVTTASRGRASWRGGERDSLSIEPGTVLIPPPGEAARIRALSGQDAGDAGDQRQMLIDMGYLEPGDGGDEDPKHHE